MRAGLEDALAVAGHDVGYAKNSIVICQHCMKPLYRLTRTIYVSEKANRTVDAYAPITMADIESLIASRGRAAGVAASLREWDQTKRAAHCASIPELRAGSPALCPACKHSFVRVRAPEAGEAADHAYTWELFTVPPGQIATDQAIRAWSRTEGA